MSSKEIALRLSISPHTVDQRVRQALRTLDVATRRDAALLLLRHQAEPPRGWRRPWATSLADRNTLTVGWRLIWIGLIASGAALSVGFFLAALESVTEMLRE
jgi:hypothetical protein